MAKVGYIVYCDVENHIMCEASHMSDQGVTNQLCNTK